MKSPIEFFFSLGDKVTKGDQKRKADFDYYMLWVIFIAFLTVFVGYIWGFYNTLEIGKLGWGIVIFGVLWFQYFTLKSAREGRKIIKSIPPISKNDEKVEDANQMIKGFSNNIKKLTKDNKSRVKLQNGRR